VCRRAQAELADLHEQVIGVKGARVGDFGGVSLSSTASATIQVNPDTEMATRLSKWWKDSGSSTKDFRALTAGAGGGGGGSGAISDLSKRKTLAAIDGENLAHGGDDGNGSVFVSKVIISKFLVSAQKASLPAYYACTNEVERNGSRRSCNKKMIFDTSTFICESCNAAGLGHSGAGKWRWILPVRIQDHSGAKVATAFDEEAKLLVGEDADEAIKRYIAMTGARPDGTDGDSDAAAGWFEGFRRKERQAKLLTIRAKHDTYNDEGRTRLTIARVRDISPATECTRLISFIQANM
jgi:replication factor A1